MPVIGPSNLIGAQAYASQIRRQSAEDTEARAAAAQREASERSSRQQSVRDEAVRIDTRQIDARRAARKLELVELSEARPEQSTSRLNSALNPTLGEVERRANPEAQPRPAPSSREAPNGPARERFVPPGTQLDIRV